MARFEAVRWAEALLAYAGDESADAVGALEEIGAAFATAGREVRGRVEADRLDAALERAIGRSCGAEGPSRGEVCARRIAVLLARRGAFGRIGEVAATARELADRRSGVVRIRAESAVPLSAEERDALRAALGRALARAPGRERQADRAAIELEERIDPAALGGIRVLDGWQRIDGTLARRLESLSRATGAAKRGGGTW